jgi:methionyl-tRNA formyltransferase
MKKLRSHLVTLFLAKPLGERCLKYLLEMADSYPKLIISEVVLSLRDASFENLFFLSKKHGLSVQIVDDVDRSQKAKIKDELVQLQMLSADLGLIIGFPHKLSSQVIQQHKHGVINLHFAPLPGYRGSGTLSHAIVNQEKEYGVTFHFIDEHLDTGPIIARKMIELPTHTSALTITHQLEELAYHFFVEHIESFLTQDLVSTDQKYYLKHSAETSNLYTRASLEKLYELAWNWEPEKILRYVYALTLGNGKKPFFSIGKTKIYLSLTET